VSNEAEQQFTTIHKVDPQPVGGASPNRVAVDETAIQIDSDRFWLYAAVDPRTNEYLHIGVFFLSKTAIHVGVSPCSKRETPLDDALLLVDAGGHLATALSRTSLRFQITRHGNRNAIERVF